MKYRALMAVAMTTTCLWGGQALAQAQGQPNTSVMIETGSATNRNSMTDFEQRMLGSNMTDDPAKAGRAYGDSVLIARCVTKLSGAKAGSLLGGPGTSDPRYTKLSNAMTGRYTSCLRGASAKSLSPALLTSAIAEELAEHDGSKDVPDRAMTLDTTKAAAFHGDMSGGVTLQNVARCEVAYSPGLARKVLATEPGSAEETAALGALYSRTPECGMATVPTSVGPVFQRSAIADALYAWTQQK